MGKQNPDQAVPQGIPSLKAPDGLAYWLVNHSPTMGLQSSVLTTDPEIAMHRYGGTGPTQPGGFLFEYHGTKVGFLTYDFEEGGWPIVLSDAPAVKDQENRINYLTVTGVGTPVYDGGARYKKDAETGQFVKDEGGLFVVDDGANKRSPWINGLDWSGYGKGRGDVFPSREVQDKMIDLWPFLMNGLIGELVEMQQGYNGKLPDGTPAWRARMQFSDAVLRKFENDDLIDG